MMSSGMAVPTTVTAITGFQEALLAQIGLAFLGLVSDTGTYLELEDVPAEADFSQAVASLVSTPGLREVPVAESPWASRWPFSVSVTLNAHVLVALVVAEIAARSRASTA